MGGCQELSAVQFPVPHHRGDTFNRGAEPSPECAVRQFQHLGRPRPHRQVGTDQDSVQSSVSRCVREGFNGLLDDRLERVHPFGSGLSAVQPGRHETCAEQRVVPQPVGPGVILQRLPVRSCRRPGRSPFRSTSCSNGTTKETTGRWHSSCSTRSAQPLHRPQKSDQQPVAGRTTAGLPGRAARDPNTPGLGVNRSLCAVTGSSRSAS